MIESLLRAVGNSGARKSPISREVEGIPPTYLSD